MKVLVTGGAGYIGSHCCKALRKAGFEPVVFDNFENGYKEFVQWGDFFAGDCRNPDDIDKAFEKFKPSAVMHFAAYAYVGESVIAPEKYYRNNVIGSFNLLEAMRHYQVKKLVFSSSCATYGVPEIIPIPESHCQNPVNPYGNTKLIMEKMMKDYAMAGHLKFIALRYFNAAGASVDGEIGEKHQPETHLIPLVLDAASGRRADVKVFGNDYDTPDGTCIRDYIHVEDLADAHVRALKHLQELQNIEPGRAFNLGNGRGFSVLEIIRSVQKVTGQKVPFSFAERRAGDPPVLVGRYELAAAQLGWEPSWPDIDDIIKHAWNYHKKVWNL
jgi:UDP-glucose-4-epimerase GalE